MRIALYKGKSLVSRAIEFLTRSPYSHAAFLLNDGTVIEAWQPTVRHVASLSAQHTPGTPVDIFGFNPGLSVLQESQLITLALKDVGTPYDYKSVLRFVTKRRGDASKKKLFCSEQVFQRCKDVGVELLLNTEAWECPPDWLARSPFLIKESTVVTT